MAEFTGRQWLFRRLVEWEHNDQPVVLIQGPPGSGKTAIAERLAAADRSSDSQPALSVLKGLAYAHFCRSREPSTLSPLTFIERLSEALANRDKNVRRALLEAHQVRVDAVGTVLVEEAHPGAEISGVRVSIQMHSYPATLAYEELVRKPLERAGGRMRPTVLVDALDEGSELGRDSIAQLLAAVVTDPAAGGVRFVLTARSADSRVDDHFRSVERIHLVRDAPAGEHDIRDFLATRLAEMPAREREIAVDRIAGASEGIFLYARHVADALLKDRAAWSRVASIALPRSLTEVYSLFLTRELARDQRDRDWRERFRPILGLLAVARGEGVSREVLIAASRLLSDARPAQLWDAIIACQPFLEASAEGRVRIFHESFREFLLTAPPYPIFVPDARDALCDHFLRDHAPDWRGQDDRYAVAYLPRHLLDSARTSDVMALLGDLAFVEAKIAGLGVPALLRDLAAAVRESPGGEDGDRARQMYEVIDRGAHRIGTPSEGDYPGRVSQHLLLAVRDPAHEWIRELAERHLGEIDAPYLQSKWHAGSESPALYRTLVGHRDAVRFVTVDGRGERALSASDDGTARLWEIETGESLAIFGPHLSRLVTAGFVRDESAILTADVDGTLRVWDVRTGDLIARHDVPGGITVIEVAVDGSSCMVGSRTGAVSTWEFGGEVRKLFPACSSAVSILRRDDRVIVAGTVEGELHVWQADDGTYRGAMTGHTDAISGLHLITPTLAVSASGDGSLRFWDLAALTCLRQVRSEEVIQCYDLAWVPGSDVILCAGTSWSVDAYDVRTGDEIARISLDKLPLRSAVIYPDKLPQRRLAMSPDGATVLVTLIDDRRLRVVDVTARDVTQELSGHSDFVYSACFTPDSRRVVTASQDRTVRVWDLTAAAGEGFDGHGASVLAVSAAEHSKLLLSSSFDHTLRGWDLETGEPRLFFSRVNQFINVIAADAFENFALAGNARGNLELFPTGDDAQLPALDYSLGRTDGVFVEGAEVVSSLVVLADLMLVVSASWNDTEVLVWNMLGGGDRLVHTLTGHTGNVRALTVLPDGFVASAAEDGSIRVWDAVDGTFSFELGNDDDIANRALETDPDGRFLLAGCGDGTLRLWDLAERRELRRIQAHDGQVRAVAWPSHGLAYSAGIDGQLMEWDMPGGTRTISVDMGSQINQLAIAKDAIYFGTAAGDMHCLTRVPALQPSTGFRSDFRLNLMDFDSIRFGDLGSLGRLEGRLGEVDVSTGYPVAGEPVSGTLALLGPRHSLVLDVRRRYAMWRAEAGDPAHAVEVMEGVLPDLVRLRGPYDSEVVAARGQLLRWRAEAGDVEGAAQAAEQLITDATQIQRSDHPSSLQARGIAAALQAQTGDAAGALEAFERLLADRERRLGAEHPETLLTRNNLLHLRGESGDTAGIVEAFEQLLADRLRALGPEHPHTLDTYAHIARWRGETGDPAAAADALERLLPDLVRIYGPVDPHTVAAYGNSAHWRGEAGDPAGAAIALEHLLSSLADAFGPDHPQNLLVYSHLAHWRAKAGDRVGADAALKQRQAILDRQPPTGHPSTEPTRDPRSPR